MLNHTLFDRPIATITSSRRRDGFLCEVVVEPCSRAKAAICS
jgi:hypothetical protein